MDRRPLLLNSVLLRQNPHNVVEWQKRVTLLEGKPREIVNTYTEAVQTVDPKQAVGKLFTLWVNFAKFYETNKQINDSRIIFEKESCQFDFFVVYNYGIFLWEGGGASPLKHMAYFSFLS